VQIGDAVKITIGPFAGLQGLLKATGPRVLIAVELGVRQVDVEMDLGWVSAAELGRRPAVSIKEPASQIRGKGA
jgi:hypothetical protein